MSHRVKQSKSIMDKIQRILIADIIVAGVEYKRGSIITLIACTLDDKFSSGVKVYVRFPDNTYDSIDAALVWTNKF